MITAARVADAGGAACALAEVVSATDVGVGVPAARANSSTSAVA
jgi:hypothetical protein